VTNTPAPDTTTGVDETTEADATTETEPTESETSPATDSATDDSTSDYVTTDDSATDDPTSDDVTTEGSGAEESDVDRLEHEGDIAADYLEELLDIADLDGDLDMDVEGDRAAVSIVGGDLRQLIGRHGEVLEALQELTRLAVYRETGERSRLMLDIGGYRADKRTQLEEVARRAVDEVRDSGEPKALEPMSPFERKVVHDVVAEAGLRSSSEGEEPRRHVVVQPG
jgi:spoIIIJ-associated protein